MVKKKLFALSCIMMSVMCNVSMAITDISEIFEGGVRPVPIEKDLTQRIIGTFQWIGYVIAIIMLVYVGIKYIMASANEKADLKDSLVKYAIGAVLIVTATTIVGWIFNS